SARRPDPPGPAAAPIPGRPRRRSPPPAPSGPRVPEATPPPPAGCRRRRLARAGAALFLPLAGQAAEAAFPALVGLDGLGQVLPAEVRPAHVGHPELRIRRLPQQEVADALLAAGADQQIG